MNRRFFLQGAAAVTAAAPLASVASSLFAEVPDVETPIAVLVVDTDRTPKRIDPRIYGQFLEHINHSVEDGLFAEQVRGAGFEGKDFETYWTVRADRGSANLVDSNFQNGSKAVRLGVQGGSAAIQQGRIFLEGGTEYDGFLWVKLEEGSPRLALKVHDGSGASVAAVPLAIEKGGWHRVTFTFTSHVRETHASLELVATGRGVLLLDFVSLARSDVRRDGMFRPDLLKALQDLGPTFIRWPGGSFASTYKWKEGIGPYPARGYHPNVYWGGYSDYYGFGTDEFLALCQRLGAQPLITLAAQGTSAEEIEYALDWVRYLNDPQTTEWGKRRAQNGHPEAYDVRLFQIDNEPMNNGFTAESYAAIVKAFGPRLRAAAPHAKIVACGQKRSSDMDWSETVIDLAGADFDVLGCHNYEYEPTGYETGIPRIRDYLIKLRDYVRASKHPQLEIGVLEWSLQHTYDWRAGLHAAGSLMLYEELSPELTMTCPALLMRNTTDDPTWAAAIYHDHVSWFPGGSYPVSKLFREHYAEYLLASTAGTFHGVKDRVSFLDHLSTAIPQGWQPGSVDAIATLSADGGRIVIKAVNYEGRRNTLLVRLTGSKAPKSAVATLHTISATPLQTASLERPDAFKAMSLQVEYKKDMAVNLEPYTVAVLEVRLTQA